jgi:hypothetical protein
VRDSAVTAQRRGSWTEQQDNPGLAKQGVRAGRRLQMQGKNAVTSRVISALASAALLTCLSGCAVLAVGGAVVGAGISVVGAVVSTGVELTGKALGAGIDAVSSDEEPDDSGISIKYTERPASGAVPALPPASAPLAKPAQPAPVR